MGLDEPETLRGFLHTLRQWWWVIALSIVLVVAAALAYSLHQTKVFGSTADVVIERQSLASSLNSIIDTNSQALEGPRVLETQAQVAKSPLIASRTIAALNIKDLTTSELLDNVTVTPDETGDVLHFDVQDSGEQRVIAITNEYVKQYLAYGDLVGLNSIKRATQAVEEKIATLKRQRASDTQLFQLLQQKKDTLRTLAVLQTSIGQVSHAADSSSQLKPKPILNATLGLALGLFLGLGLALLFAALDTRFRSAEALAGALSMPLIARIPRGGRRDTAEPAMLTNPNGRRAEAYRRLRANLNSVSESTPSGSLLVTSVNDVDDGTAVAMNLAVAEAGAGRNVLLVGLNLREDGVERILKVDSRVGIVEALRGEVQLADAISDVPLTDPALPPTTLAVKKLNVLPRGSMPSDPGEFVAGRNVSAALESLAGHFDLVVVSAPPLLQYSDAITLAGAVDAILVVATPGDTKRPQAEEAMRMLAGTASAKIGVAAIE